MALNDIKISELPPQDLVDLTDDTIIVTVDSALTNKQVTIGDLKAYLATLPFYVFEKVSNFTVPDDNYIEVARITTLDQPIGVYRYQMDWSYTYDSINTSVFLEFSIDGGVNYTEFVGEQKDSSDARPDSYGFMIDYTAPTAFDFLIRMRKETAGNTLLVQFMDLSIERKV